MGCLFSKLHALGLFGTYGKEQRKFKNSSSTLLFGKKDGTNSKNSTKFSLRL